MWLLDANMDVHLVELLKELGIQADSAARRGWQDLLNGELVEKSIAAGFSCVVTQDRLFAEAAGRVLSSHPDFGVVVVRLPQKTSKLYLADFKSAWQRAAIKPIAGKIVVWPPK